MEDIQDVKNWPKLFFNFVLTILGMAIIYGGSAVLNRLDKATEAIIDLRTDFRLSAQEKKHLEEEIRELKLENKEQNEKHEKLREEVRQRHSKE